MGDGMRGARKLWAVIRREYEERVRSKWFVVATLFGPLFFGGIMVIPPLLAERGQGKADGARIVVVDATGAGLGVQVASALAGGALGRGTPPRVVTATGREVAAAESLATRLVVADSVRGYLVLDSATLAAGAARYAGGNTTALFDMQRLEGAVQRALVMWRIDQGGVDPELGRRLAATTVRLATERLTARGRGGSGQLNLFAGLAVAMLLYVMMFIYGIAVMRGVLEEKQSRVAEVVIASIAPGRLLLGKVLGVCAVGLTQMGVWLGASLAFWHWRAPLFSALGVPAPGFTLPALEGGTLAVLLAFFITGFLLYSGIFAATGASVNSEQEAQQAQTPVMVLLVSTIVFAQSVLMQPDGTLARVLSLLPHSAPIMMPMRMTVTQVPTVEVALALASVAAGAAVSIWAAARIYRVGLLMTGKRATVAELLRWLRG
ncbi:MAG: ABC transporter permease [Gemmatimonadetes bacterium]|nr:ABC transporter permease [Gemmatimonadota bacterium]